MNMDFSIMSQHKYKPGPKPDTVRVEGDVDWKDALKHAMGKGKEDKKQKPEEDKKESS